MLVQGGTYKGRRILGRKTVDFMVRNHLTERQAESLDWDSVKGYGVDRSIQINYFGKEEKICL